MADDEQVEGLEATADHRLRGLLEALPDLLLVISSDNVFVDYHAPDPDILLVPPSAFIGRKIDEVGGVAVCKLCVESSMQPAEAARADFEARRRAFGAGRKQTVDETGGEFDFTGGGEASRESAEEGARRLAQRLPFRREPLGETRAFFRERVDQGGD